MKSSYLKLAMAGVLSLAGAQAMALAPSAIDSSVVALYVSGATATDGAFENLAKLSSGELCQAGTLDIYFGTKTKVLFCTAGFTSGTTIVAGTTKLAVFKESNGGSAYGISNVGGSLTSNMSFIDFFTGSSNVSTACATAVPVNASGDFAAYNTRTCTSPATIALAPDAGISDIDPGTFVRVGTGSGVTSTQVAALTHKRQAIAVTFNPIVSTTLFTALQGAQGLTQNTSSLANVPSLSSSQVRGIFQGMITDGSQIYTNGTALASGQIYICRRGNTSGTMASFKLQYLNQGCTTDAGTTSAFVTPTLAATENSGTAWVSGTHGSNVVFAGSGSGDVRACMDYHSGAGHYAVGVASTESLPGTGAIDPNTGSALKDRFRYIKVDGAEPTLKAVMEGRYDFFTENSWNDKLSTSSAKYLVWNQLYSKIGTAAVLKKINESWYNAAAITSGGSGAADTGLLDLPNVDTAYGPTFPISDAGVRSTPINSQTRTAYGSNPNACNRTYTTFP